MFEKELEDFDLAQIKIAENLIYNYFANYTNAYIFQNVIKYKNSINNISFVSMTFDIDKRLCDIGLALTKDELCNLNPGFFNEISKLGDVTILAQSFDPVVNCYEKISFEPKITLIEKFNSIIHTASHMKSHTTFDIFLKIS